MSESAVPALPETPPSVVAALADDSERKRDPMYVRLQTIVCWVVTGVAALGGLIALTILRLVSELPFVWLGLIAAAWLAFVILLAIIAIFWPALEYRYSSYRLNPERIEIREGVYWRHVVTVPRSRVQHTDVSQGPIERQLGLATLILHTAGTEHATVRLPGLAHATASSIRDHLVAGGIDDAV